MTFTLWLPLTLCNAGRSAATDVLVDLTIPHCRRLLLQRPGHGIITDTPNPLVLEQALDDRREACIKYVESLDDGLGIRQRIRRILGKSSERLVFLGVVLDDAREWLEDSTIEVAYSIRDLSGAAHDSSLQIPVTIRQGETLSAGTAQAFHARAGG